MPKTKLLLLPGLLCDGAVWEDQARALADIADSFVQEYGLTGSISAMARGVLRSAPDSFALAGHSMGGRVALEIMRQAPQRVERLALLNAGFDARPEGPDGEAEARERFALLTMARSQGMRAMGREWVQGMVHPDRLADQALIGEILKMIERRNHELFHAQIAALLERPDAEPVLARIACPTLILCGREDAQSPLARYQKMAALIQGSMLHVVERCGHMSPMEQPDDVTLSLRSWLALSPARLPVPRTRAASS